MKPCADRDDQGHTWTHAEDKEALQGPKSQQRLAPASRSLKNYDVNVYDKYPLAGFRVRQDSGWASGAGNQSGFTVMASIDLPGTLTDGLHFCRQTVKLFGGVGDPRRARGALGGRWRFRSDAAEFSFAIHSRVNGFAQVVDAFLLNEKSVAGALHRLANCPDFRIALKDSLAIDPRKRRRNFAGVTDDRARGRLIAQVCPLKVERIAILDSESCHFLRGRAPEWRFGTLVAIHVEKRHFFASQNHGLVTC